MRFFDEIRQQPEHIRHIFMWTMVVITFSIISFVWVRGTARRVVVLLNPEKESQRVLASAPSGAGESNAPSPFAAIVGSFKDLRANIAELLRVGKVQYFQNRPAETTIPPQTLPVK